ncbi:MAG: GNAT family N-acetyltransferase [Porcipelethomonas sp.]
MKIRQLSKSKLTDALPLVWDVFLKYEAVSYSEEGKKAFYDAIHSEEYLDMLTAYGAYDGRELAGIIAVRNHGSHIALFFVDGKYHRQGIGRALWNAVLAENVSAEITVHSSLYAVEVYKKLGFEITGDVREDGGIQYVPMKYRMVYNEDCPCTKLKCIRHGRCNECRAHHAKRGRPRPCERN